MPAKRKNLIRAALFAVALVFIIFGGFRGEMLLVFKKAASICLECVGIG
jgi:hypothetical protein